MRALAPAISDGAPRKYKGTIAQKESLRCLGVGERRGGRGREPRRGGDRGNGRDGAGRCEVGEENAAAIAEVVV
jgi:hypothetical protein